MHKLLVVESRNNKFSQFLRHDRRGVTLTRNVRIGYCGRFVLVFKEFYCLSILQNAGETVGVVLCLHMLAPDGCEKTNGPLIIATVVVGIQDMAGTTAARLVVFLAVLCTGETIAVWGGCR